MSGTMLEDSGSRSKPSAFSTQRAVISALMLRELHSRFGRDNIGYLWLIGEPMMLATVISTIHYFTSHAHKGMQPYPFTLIGYCLFIIFRGIFNRAEGAVEGSSSLMYHKMVKPLDVMIVKTIIESLGCVASLIVLMAIGIVLGIAEFPVRPLYLMTGAFMITWWSFALSLIVASVTYGSHTLGRFVHPISYFAVPLSGAFWTMSLIPGNFRSAMEWNPMVGMFETARYGQFEWADDKYMHLGYQVTVCACLTLVGLVFIRKLQRRIHA
ncbi:ABC transporter permease [Sphingobium sp. MI1205]|uniref:ABC transporter permease n=1 Tax=Sphingobium sp. MI1205 TaxID=407020 RepID=UPI0007865F5D|nr:ABC transporter permease [Sphingobium sp. MI1205]